MRARRSGLLTRRSTQQLRDDAKIRGELLELACAIFARDLPKNRRRVHRGDFQRHGVTLLLPSVNDSSPWCSLQGREVRLGLSMVKHLAATTARQILETRPFESFAHFRKTVRTSRQELEALVMCGACDGLAPLEPEAYPFAHRAVIEGQPVEARLAVGTEADRWRALQRIKHELLYLDVHVTVHPLEVLRAEATRVGCVTVSQLSQWRNGRAHFAGLVAASRRHRTQTGRLMQFVTFEDETGLVESTLLLQREDDAISSPGPWLVEGRVHHRERATRVEVIGVRPFHQRPRAFPPAPGPKRIQET